MNYYSKIGIELGGITESLNDKVDRDLDNASVDISNFPMPSNRYINLIPDVSGTEYTAPAAGWIYVRKKASAVNQYVALRKKMFDNKYIEASVMWSQAATTDMYVNMPVRKGEVFQLTFTTAGTSEAEFFIFVYANGAA